MAEESKGFIKTQDYAFEQARKNASDLVALRDANRTLLLVVRDLVYIVKELCDHQPDIADETYGSALDGHMAALDEKLGEGEGGS